MFVFFYFLINRPLRGALFLLDLIIDATGIHYSTPPENFETTVVAIYDKGIAVTQSIEQLEKVRKLMYDFCTTYISMCMYNMYVKVSRILVHCYSLIYVSSVRTYVYVCVIIDGCSWQILEGFGCPTGVCWYS